MSASELADWMDKQKRDSEKILGDWVEENPQWWAIGLATAAATSMDLGQGLWDALRLGEGAAEGGVKGFGKDALRLLTLAGPLAKGGAMAGRLAQTQMIRLAVTTADVTGPCTFTAVNNAATIAKGLPRNLFILASDAAEALGKPLGTVAKWGSQYKLAAWIDDLIPFVTKQGLRLRNLGPMTTIDEVARMNLPGAEVEPWTVARVVGGLTMMKAQVAERALHERRVGHLCRYEQPDDQAKRHEGDDGELEPRYVLPVVGYPVQVRVRDLPVPVRA